MKRIKGSAEGLIVTLMLAAACQQPAAAPATLTDADRQAITAVFQDVAQRIRTSDWDGFLASFDDDVVFMPNNAPMLRGKDALRAWVNAGPKPASAFDFSNVEVNGEGNLAYGTSTINMAFEGMPPEAGKQLVVLRKMADGSWKTVAVAFNSDTPLPMPGAPATTTTAQ